MRTLVLCAHGTDSPAGRQVTLDLVRAVQQELPEVAVVDAYVDVQSPKVADVVKTVVSHGDSVTVVPLLLCAGYHVQVDIAAAVAPFEAAEAAGPLGPDDLLTEVLIERLVAAGARRGEPVILAAAGSSRAQAAHDAEAAAAMLSQAWGGPVMPAYGSAAQPSVAEAVAQTRARGERAVIAAYLLGAGFFHDKLRASGADIVTEPLGADPTIVRLIVQRAG